MFGSLQILLRLLSQNLKYKMRRNYMKCVDKKIIIIIYLVLTMYFQRLQRKNTES